jgi:hypothetical protein
MKSPLQPTSPTRTEIAYDTISHVEQSSEERIETGNVAYEPIIPNSSKATEDLGPMPSLIAADRYMRNPDKNHGPLLGHKALFCLVKMGWLTLTDVSRYFNQYDYVALAHYNDKLDEQQYPFVVVSKNESIPTPSQRVRLSR